MGSEFLVFLRLGFEHIADPRGYDHILFIVALTATYVPRQWRRVLALVTAFTVGHSITLALATLRLIRIPTDLVEFLIPVTIFVTAAVNLAQIRRGAVLRAGGTAGPAGDDMSMQGRTSPAAPERTPAAADETSSAARRTRYLLALGFGLIHGMGFSNFLRAALGAEASVAWPLFAFNVGLEVGQVVIVLLVLAATAGATRLLRLPQEAWVAALSAPSGALALFLAWDRLPL